MSQKYQDFIKNYLKEADEQNNLQQVYNYILTGKSDVKIADVLAKMSEEEIKKLFPDNFKDEFLKHNKLTFKVVKDGKDEIKSFDLTKDTENPVVETFIKLFNDKNNGDGAKRFRIASGITTDEFANYIKKFASQSKWSFNSAASEYEQLGRILTYRSIDVIYKLGNKEQISQKEILFALKNAFKTEKVDYFQNLQKIDTKMLVDAVAGTKEAAARREESVEFKTYNLLTEASDIEQMPIKEFFEQAYSQGKDDKIIQWLKPYIDDHKEDVETNKKTLQARFEKGRKEIIEKEKSDKEQDFTDPVTGTVEKRVGRLGHFGPMTYIKNHEDLNKAIDAIDKQKWNIFNCAAKLLIKFFKLIEHGEKKWQEFLNDVRSGQKEILANIDNMKQQDFVNKMDEITNEETQDSDIIKANNEKIIQILLTYCEDVAKYEAKFIEQFSGLKDKNLVTFNKDDKTFDINSNVLEFINSTKNNLMNTENGLSKAQDTIKQLLEAKPEEASEEKQEEAPQQAASYKPVYNNPVIDEANDVVQQTQDAINDEADKAKEDNKKKEEENKNKEQKKEKTEPIDWRNTKFAFNLQTEIAFGNLDKFYNDGSFGKEAELYQKMAEKVSDNGLKLYLESFGKLLALFNSKSNNARLLSQDEVATKAITAGELVDKTNTLFDTLKNIHQIEAFNDVSIDNMDEIRNEFASIVQEISKPAEVINDPIILAIGYEKKEEQNAEPPKEIQQEVNTVDKQIVASLEKLQDQNTKIDNVGSVIEQFTKANEELDKLSNNDNMKKFIALAKKKFQKMLAFFLPKVYLYTKFANDGNFSQQIEQQHEAFIEELEPIVLNLNEAQPIDWDAIEKSAIQIMNGIKPMLENPKEKDIQQFYNEYTKWVAGVNKLINDLTNRNDFKKEHGKVVDELKKHQDPFYRYLVIFSFLKMKNQNTEEGENKEGQEQSQEGNTEGNTEGQAKEGTIEGTPTQKPKKQIDKSKVQDAQLADNFQSELAEELYKYLRG